MLHSRYQARHTYIALLFSILAGCSGGMKQVCPGSASDVPPVLRSMYNRDFRYVTFQERLETHYRPQRELESEWRRNLIRL